MTDATGVGRARVEGGHQRTLTTVFGEVTVTRLAYRARQRSNLHPADARLNLPVEKHSHGLRKLAAVEASRGSFDGAVEAIERATGVRLGKRQCLHRFDHAGQEHRDEQRAATHATSWSLIRRSPTSVGLFLGRG